MAGYDNHRDDIVRRLRRIEGQVRGLQRMVAEETYCIDILTQISATNAALQSCALALLDEHLNCCVTDAIVEGGDKARAKVTEASKAIARLVKA
ncbi:DNA-binding FrmR family transcriptional regulator [Streptomyces sp. LBL]|uniref:metal-sensitive transcriptional regulator n=1 Tax=Streptomyces sp. LBL TaxID=2940562 RepID=UPI0024740E0C|nr:metal-sensitive transcriptional regulator [Streptomyces sp. LBL]MDH6630485.1 DNA-binding FrmR family transcriptional regulator [Streptomyces sp. LBL]